MWKWKADFARSQINIEQHEETVVFTLKWNWAPGVKGKPLQFWNMIKVDLSPLLDFLLWDYVPTRPLSCYFAVPLQLLVECSSPARYFGLGSTTCFGQRKVSGDAMCRGLSGASAVGCGPCGPAVFHEKLMSWELLVQGKTREEDLNSTLSLAHGWPAIIDRAVQPSPI